MPPERLNGDAGWVLTSTVQPGDFACYRVRQQTAGWKPWQKLGPLAQSERIEDQFEVNVP